MLALLAIDSVAEGVKKLIDSLVVSGFDDGYIFCNHLRVTSPYVDWDELYIEVEVDNRGRIDFPSSTQKEKAAFKLALRYGNTTKITIPITNFNGHVVVDIEVDCYKRIIDRLKKGLPEDAVLFYQSINCESQRLFELLGFKAERYLPAEGDKALDVNVMNFTLALADWRSPSKVGDMRTLEEDHTSSPSATKKAKV